MTLSQIVLYGSLALVLVVYLRRVILARTIRQYTPAEAVARMKESRNVVLLDVRTDRERSAGSIRGSLHIPLHHLLKRIDGLSAHKGKEIICYCQTGNRSLAAAARLRRLGFTVASLSGGMAEWRTRQA